MIRLETNMEQVVAGLINRLDVLRGTDQVLREAALNAAALVTNRVQQRGELADGGKIGGGSYSPGYRQYRARKGRQTSFVDLTQTGQMMDSFTVAGDGAGAYVVGFATTQQALKAAKNEAYYGRIFILSPGESQQVLTIIRKRLDAIFGKRP